MLRSENRILTTHTGSLPRPDTLRDALLAHEGGGPEPDPGTIRDAVAETVRSQSASHVDVVNDGEMSKVGYSTYVKERLTGFEGEPIGFAMHDFDDFPEFGARVASEALATLALPSCSGEVTYRGADAVAADIANLKSAVGAGGAGEAFLTAASPGVVALFLGNRHYPDRESFLGALADAMKQEYDAIHRAGLLLQVDCPDLAMSYQMIDPMPTVEEFRHRIAQNIEALNHALRDIPPEAVRLHLCWANYNGPHVCDIPLASILDVIVTANVGGISFEGANPRHEHEWRVFEDFTLPGGMVILPGVIDSTSNFVDHPELVAERITRYANAVGRERVLASSDCGFATFAGYTPVDPRVTWRKLASMAEGAELASRQLWR